MPITTRARGRVPEPRTETQVTSNTTDLDPAVPPNSPSSDEGSVSEYTPTSTSRTAKTHKRKQSSISICNASDPAAVKRFDEWQSRLKALMADAKKDGIDIYDEVHSVSEMVEQSLAIVESVDEYKKAEGNAGKDVKVVSFSNATWKDLERISMPRHKVVVINFESLLTSIRLHMPESLLKATEAEAPRLDDVLQELNGFVGTQTESGARVFINQWLIAVKRILRNEFAAFVWTELCLSSASAQPVHIEEDNQTTFLTGVIDYGLASMRITMVDEEETVMQQRISIMNELQTKRIVGVFGQHRVTFVIIEAKNDRERLETHIPQVVLQCVALEEEWTEGGSKIVAFCLANSKRWMFGVVDRVSGRIFHTKEQNVTQDLLQILLGLVFWASNSSQDILITILSAIKARVQ